MICRMRRLEIFVLCAAAWLGGCQHEAGRAPVARFDITPEYIPIDDGYTTVVTLDGSGSKDEFDDPAGTLPLAFHWEIEDPALQVVDGSLTAAKVQVRLKGDRPTTVTLTVIDATGRQGLRTGYVGVTVPDPDGGVGQDAGQLDAAPDDASAADAPGVG
jgi:hypothetical protein